MSAEKYRVWGIDALVLALGLSSLPTFAATNFVETDLISDTPGAAAVVDPNLVGTWGISFSATGPFWVSNAGNGTSTIYTVSDANPPTLTAPTISTLVVTIPPSANDTMSTAGFPTGQVNNGYGAGNFEVVPGAAAGFIFASLDGTISGSHVGTTAGKHDRQLLTPTWPRCTRVLPSASAARVQPCMPRIFPRGLSTPSIAIGSRSCSPGFFDPDLEAGFYPSDTQRFGRRLYVALHPRRTEPAPSPMGAQVPGSSTYTI